LPVKLYAYTMDYSLPRLALKGFSEEIHLQTLEGAAQAAIEDSTEKARAVVLEIDADEIPIIPPSFRSMDGIADGFAEDATYGRDDLTEEQKQALYEKAYDEMSDKLSTAEDPQLFLDLVGYVKNDGAIPPSKITVLGHPTLQEPDYAAIHAAAEAAGKEPEYPEPTVTFDAAPKPLKSFKQPLVSRLLRSIFLPQHKLYGAGKRRSPSMGFLSRFLPKREDVDVADEPPSDVVSGVPLVWAAGKTFRRGMRGAFGNDGDAIAQLVAMRAGQEPGKYLGSGAKGAVYALGQGLVLKVTMDGSEIQAAAHLIGVRHPNLSLVHDVFVVTDGGKGAGIIVRDSVDTTLNKFDKKASQELDEIMDQVLESSKGKIGSDVTRMEDVEPKVLADEVELMIELLRIEGCEVDEGILLDLADAFRALRHYGILGIDFDSKNVGVIKKPKPRVVIFDYGMTKSPPAEVEVVGA
jgi:hypothetical protein